uniref:Putative methyltransferase YcgJ n=1 Tax=Thermosporothrix sp. COM3 TaxID=2490863 RepID=A0A455SDJ4_9CHLR|nr:putative methyltransferase YcgJ [Thermosporothrix sp. COM3]
MSQDSNEEKKRQQIQQQFGAAAKDYVTSTVHAAGPDLPWLVEAAALTGSERVADVATGTGHTALALAPFAHEVVAVDLTESMLEGGRHLARERGITNVEFIRGDAHALPLPENNVDVVTCRYAAHHFIDVSRAAQEWARVLKSGGKLVLLDSIAPEDETLDGFLNEIEALRDPSHVRNHRVSEWLVILKEAGIEAHEERSFDISLDFLNWTQRQRTSAENVQRLRELFSTASEQIRTALHIEPDGDEIHFTIPIALIVGTAISSN